MVTCVGKEKVDFSSSLKLVGKVESYLTDLIGAMRSSLNDIAKSSV